ncbi:HAD-IIIC family phosphatase [Vibrio sp. Of7-15]|uniref:HAD-IIIC family phosphatase n=1 Tax=Vibrio sp. Of7-15 TaxID=2724879 RepID=UPI001EF17720|nr:HAD-IIIC family phosphatase [Vibrio sp. Of7-15]MCG7495627.1 HAD-IIIC family phosphatase [Vibrio sp. Of7-15]
MLNNTANLEIKVPMVSLSNKAIKCIVWDLDNTLWEGILSEGDNVTLKPGIVSLIEWLDRRGVINSIASKNCHEDAMAKLKSFGIDHLFLYPQINWNAKSESVKNIQQSLNIGIDTFLFVDDQVFEREEVAAVHPLVTTLDALDYQRIESLPRIINFKVSDDAAMRRVRYQEDMMRQESESKYSGTPEHFLSTLNMQFKITAACKEDLLRAEELTLRTNQLNSTGVTYNAQELEKLMNDENHDLLVCELTDKFGSYGKIGLVLIEKGVAVDKIKLLLMSCRVASRGVGSVLLTHLNNYARQRGIERLQADFRRTTRNRQMLMTYQFSGFSEIRKNAEDIIVFEKPISSHQPYPEYINVLTA